MISLSPTSRYWGLKVLLLTFIFDTLIAPLHAIFGIGNSFLRSLIMSQCIGLSIASMAVITYRVLQFRRQAYRLVALSGAIPAGAVIGITLGNTILDISQLQEIASGVFIKVFVLSLIIGTIITNFFISRREIAETREKVQEETIKRLSSEKDLVESELKRLQAQIEPHFLFNTLSTIMSLLDTDSEKAKSMLADLNRYLRSSLSKTRQETTTVKREVETLTAYLNIFQIRMEERLSFEINIPEAYQDVALPPLLLQPVVENAIQHGLEPKIEGGRITVEAEKAGDILRFSISDTGLGMSPTASYGVGLTNISDRLKRLYGEKGRITLSDNTPSGLTVIIEVPYVTG